MKERRSTSTTTTNMRQHTRTTASWKSNEQGGKHTTHGHANNTRKYITQTHTQEREKGEAKKSEDRTGKHKKNSFICVYLCYVEHFVLRYVERTSVRVS